MDKERKLIDSNKKLRAENARLRKLIVTYELAECDKTFKTLGNILGVTQGRASSIHHSVLRRFRRELSGLEFGSKVR